jgi:hypothetical protein
MKKKVKMGWEVPVKDRRKAHVYYGGQEEEDSSRKFVLKWRPGEKYSYVEVTGWLKKQVPIEDYDKEAKDWYEIDIRDDKQMDMFVVLSPIRDIRQLQYLVFSLMGYQFNEICDVMKLGKISSVKELQVMLLEQMLANK